MIIKKLFSFSVLLFATALLAGCADYPTIIAQKDSEIMDNRMIIDNLRTELNACFEDSSTSSTQCHQKLEEQDQQLLLREQELRARLAEDIKNKNIEIERLKGRLTVRVMDQILFNSGSIKILPGGKEVLARIAENLADTNEHLSIEGHTDDVPIGVVLAKHVPTNWELSVLRAVSVVRFLEGNNIPSERMSAVGHSEFKPSVENTTDENKQLNRRVEIVLIPLQN